MSISHASHTLKVSCNSIYLWQTRLQEQGSLEATTGYHNPCNRQIKDLSHFAKFVSSRRDWTQQELADAYGVSAKVVGRALKNLGWTRKKVYRYRERDEVKRAKFQQELRKYQSKGYGILYIDESGCDERMQYEYGYSPPGEKIYGKKQGSRRGRVSLIGPCQEHRLREEVVTLEGSCNRTVIETWLTEQLLPRCEGEYSAGDGQCFVSQGRAD